MSDLRKLLDQYRDAAKSQRELGDYLEKLTIDFIEHDPGMQQEYEGAWTFTDWAREHGMHGGDTGVDVVAKIRGEDSYCAIQCKFYGDGATIPKSEIDKFLSKLAAEKEFSRGLIVETTGRPFTENASTLFDKLDVNVVGIDRLEASPIDWARYFKSDAEDVVVREGKQLYPHQREAVDTVKSKLQHADRGKLIMACGTGKTFTGLRIAEEMVGEGGIVLVLVPSLALMSQTIREWTIDADVKLRSFAVCSDSQVGKRRTHDDAGMAIHDLDYPATTSPGKLVSKALPLDNERMTVIFATYHSIQVVADAQKHSANFPDIDLIICDEAHRTTGATREGDDESVFVKVHNQDVIRAKKRLYMTATPRVYADSAKSKAEAESIELASMDDPEVFGETLFTKNFGWAVQNGFLTDYKVIVLAVDEGMVSASVQQRLKNEDSSLDLDDATKIIGCYKALLKSGLREELLTDPQPMQRGLIFAKDIASSKMICSEFPAVVDEYLDSPFGELLTEKAGTVSCDLQHVDGTQGARERNEKLDWLKDKHGDRVCRMLTNAKCLSEGVDVPALDAVMFMHPKKSVIEVTQAVGRVMRKAKDKKLGYVILPIGVPAGMTPEEALQDNERYRVVWQILNALRSHDERFDAMINKAGLGVDVSDHLEIVPFGSRIEVTDKVNEIAEKQTGKKTIGIGTGGEGGDEPGEGRGNDSPTQMPFAFDEFAQAILARIVKKCGRRDYWEDWAGDIARIAQAHISRITGLVEQEGSAERAAFEAFLAEIRDDLNDEVTEGEAIEMLAQHLITRPVFEALFENYSFTDNNPVSRALEGVLKTLDAHNIDKETAKLERFYESVRRRAAGIDEDAAKQKIVVELYDKFFRNAFPKMTDRLGIVYTPIEIVDFILKSVDELLQSEFGQSLGSEGVHILDPFTGTGTFITRLLQSGLIKPEEMQRKYEQEIHANEIVLLAYYIAAINIEAAYHGQVGGDYKAFEGICLTDTFQLYEQDKDLLSKILPVNSDRRTRQRELPVRVIVGNPPYSVGQGDANANATNVSYPLLDDRIRETYAALSDARNKNSLFNSYIRAFRWASDRVGSRGIVGFVTGAGWIDGNSTDGMRKSLADEFTSLHVFHLRGKRGQHTAGEQAKREGGQIFGSGSAVPIAISLLVKNPDASEHGQIHFHDIGDYLDRDEKLVRICEFGSVGGITEAGAWQSITPDEHGDWLGQRDKAFEKFISIGDKKSPEPSLFENYSAGVKTQRDAWAYNFSEKALAANMRRMIGFYEDQRASFANAYPPQDRKAREKAVDSHIDTDAGQISWTRALKSDLVRDKSLKFDHDAKTTALYRPFSPMLRYYDRRVNEMVYQIPKFFPLDRGDFSNRLICLPNKGEVRDFSVIMTSLNPDLHVIHGGQCFPRWTYEKSDERDGELALEEASESGLVKKEAITDDGLSWFEAAYPGELITKDDLFYYTYGILHSPEYRGRFSDNLTKELPRIPAVKTFEGFQAFVEAGRTLGDLHCDFDAAEPFAARIEQGALELATIDDPVRYFRVEKMKHAKVRDGKTGKLKADKSTIIYNGNITLSDIPLEAYEFIVDGRPAVEWVMDRQGVKTDKKSGIIWDANAYANETMGDPMYPLKLLQRVITISLETMKIVDNLPPLDID